MSLWKIAKSNIKHNFKNYIMYFFAMCFCVFTSYTFASLTTNEEVLNKIFYDKRYSNMFIGFGITILVFFFFFLVSSNNSFLRARKREISTYALFGMTNAKIGWLMFLETLFTGTIAIAVGISLGIFFSKLTAMIVLKMVMADVSTGVQFLVEPEAVLYTIGAFLIIFCGMGLTGVVTINKFQLVELFKGEQQAEKRRNGSYIILILSLLLIGGGYYRASDSRLMVVVQYMIPVIVVVIIGTYLFLGSGVQRLLNNMKKRKRNSHDYKRLVPLSFISHKMRTTTTMMSTIAILIAVSTTAMAFGYVFYKTSEAATYRTNLFDTYFYSDKPENNENAIQFFDEKGIAIEEVMNWERHDIKGEINPMPEEFQQYNITFDSYAVFNESTYNELGEIAKKSNEKIKITKGTAILPWWSFSGGKEDFENIELIINGEAFELVFDDIVTNYGLNARASLILNDEDYSRLLKEGIIAATGTYFTGINYKNALNDKETAELLRDELNKLELGGKRISYYTYMEFISIAGVLCFIGYFICAIFILMTASLLYFKHVTIATEEKKQYVMLRKIGMTSDEENKIIKRRLIPIFFIPLVIGVIHSVFAMKGADTIIFSNTAASNVNTYLQVLQTSAVIYLVYIGIYTVFYFITKAQYKHSIQ